MERLTADQLRTIKVVCTIRINELSRDLLEEQRLEGENSEIIIQYLQKEINETLDALLTVEKMLKE